jgi:hypothetical protein
MITVRDVSTDITELDHRSIEFADRTHNLPERARKVRLSDTSESVVATLTRVPAPVLEWPVVA